MRKFLVFVICAFAVSSLPAQSVISREYDIKAVFLFNFTQFVEWPAATFAGREAPFVIGILGEDPFQSFIDKTVSGERVGGRPIVIRRYEHINEVRNCHILFISNRESKRVKDMISTLRNRPVLTVSDMPGFANNGGMISFVTRDNKIKLQVNPTVTRASGLSVSSKLLRISEIVGE